MFSCGDLATKSPIPDIDFDQLQVSGTATVAGKLIIDEGGSLILEDFVESPVIMATGGVSGPFTSIEIDNMIDDWPWYLLYRSNEITILLGGNVFVPFLRK